MRSSSEEASLEKSEIVAPSAEESKLKVNFEFNFKVPEPKQCEHGKNMVFYCSKHEIVVCPACLMSKHITCAQAVPCNEDTLSNSLKTLKEAFMAEIARANNRAEKVKKDYDGLIKGVNDDKTTSEKLCTAISTAATSLANEHKEAEDKVNAGFAKHCEDSKTGVEEDIKNYKSTADQIGGGDSENSLLELIKSYYNMQVRYQKFQTVASANIKEPLDNLTKAIEESTDTVKEFEEDFVKSQLKSTVARIHGKDTTTRDDQCTSKYLYALHPLMSTVTVVNISTRKSETRVLVLNGKETKFSVPYGAASVQYDGRIFITGGSNDLMGVLQETYEYSMFKDKLIPRGMLLEARSDHSMVMAGDAIYCIGGKSKEKELSTCEMCVVNMRSFSPEVIKKCLDKGELPETMYKWKSIKGLSEEKAMPSLCVCGDYIYAFGGQANETAKWKIERFHFTDSSSSWEPAGNMKELAGYGFGCASGSRKVGDKTVDGIIVFGGLKNKTYFLVDKGPDANADDEMVEIEGCVLSEAEDFTNMMPVRTNARQLWAMGKSRFYILRDEKEDKPRWETREGYEFYSI